MPGADPSRPPPPLPSVCRRKERTQRLQAQVAALQAENAALEGLLADMAATGGRPGHQLLPGHELLAPWPACAAVLAAAGGGLPVVGFTDTAGHLMPQTLCLTVSSGRPPLPPQASAPWRRRTRRACSSGCKPTVSLPPWHRSPPRPPNSTERCPAHRHEPQSSFAPPFPAPRRGAPIHGRGLHCSTPTPARQTGCTVKQHGCAPSRPAPFFLCPGLLRPWRRPLRSQQ